MVLSREEFSKLNSEQKGEYLRRLKGIKGKGDLIYLLNEILGYKEVERGVHGEIAERIEVGGKKQLYLLPRGYFKTTVITIGGVIREILRDGDVRVLIDSEVLDYSQRLVAQIKRDMGKGEFVRLYGDMVDKRSRETAREFTVNTRRNQGLKEPTVSAAGVGTVQVGPHYDLIVADDLHSEKNVGTKEQIEKVIAHYKLLLSLLEPTGKLIIVGTRWHYFDLYSHILEEEVPRAESEWEVLVEKAIRDDGTLSFPKRLSREFLEQQRIAQGNYLFSVLYQNNPVDNEDAVFKKTDFRYWSGENFPEQDGKRIFLNLYILIDRAFSSNEKADFTGCACVGVSSQSNIYVLEAERHKFGLQELFDLIVVWIKKYGQDRVRKVGIETINWEEVDMFFREKMGKKNMFFILERLMPDHGKNKTKRISDALAARVRNHALYIKKGMWDLEDEMMRFPVGTHDDILDSVSYVVPSMVVPGDPGIETDNFDYEPSGLFGAVGY